MDDKQAEPVDLDQYVTDLGDWWLYQLPDGRQVRVDLDGPLRFAVDVERGQTLHHQSTEQVEALLRHLIARAL